MAKKVLLCASAFHLSAAVWNGSRLTVLRSFEDEMDEVDRMLGVAWSRPDTID